jgi:hypothetical protein
MRENPAADLVDDGRPVTEIPLLVVSGGTRESSTIPSRRRGGATVIVRSTSCVP